MTPINKPLVLIILDGWGHREAASHNAIAAAKKPTWDHLLATCPHTLLNGSGTYVGLPDGQMGNSEVGHLTMGSGRILYQDLTRIDYAIQQGDFFRNPIFEKALTQVKSSKKSLHIMGLLSPGGVHSHERHLHALIKLAAQYELSSVYLHLFLDGRDTPPQSAQSSIATLETLCHEVGCGKIVSMIGRYYAMDRDKRWERIEPAYRLLTEGVAPYQASTAEAALALAYARGETDEFVQATSIHQPDASPITLQDGDSLIFMNFRSDRARELTEAILSPDFKGFVRKKWPKLANFVSLSAYDERLPTQVAFPPQTLNHLLSTCLSEAGLTQLRLAETEKYAHVTFFFNGGIEKPYPGEDRLLIPSLKVATYDLAPEMSAKAITEALVKAIHDQHYDVIICNYANADMVGHTGNLAASIKAITCIDQSLHDIILALKSVGGEALITADHGNAEELFDEHTKQPHTAHTAHLVPFIFYTDRQATIMKNNGNLSDIAPTMLYLLGLPQPKEMTGSTLLHLEE